jgi:hypothetical protein
VLCLAGAGLGNTSIGKRFGLSRKTVNCHFTELFDRLGVVNRTQAVMLCLREGWIRLEEIEENPCPPEPDLWQDCHSSGLGRPSARPIRARTAKVSQNAGLSIGWLSSLQELDVG